MFVQIRSCCIYLCMYFAYFSYNSLGSTSVFMGKSLEIQLCKLEFILCWEEGICVGNHQTDRS